MSDWTWEYVPDAANVVGGLTPVQVVQVERLASRIADAVAVRRIGTSSPSWDSRAVPLQRLPGILGGNLRWRSTFRSVRRV